MTSTPLSERDECLYVNPSPWFFVMTDVLIFLDVDDNKHNIFALFNFQKHFIDMQSRWSNITIHSGFLEMIEFVNHKHLIQGLDLVLLRIEVSVIDYESLYVMFHLDGYVNQTYSFTLTTNEDRIGLLYKQLFFSDYAEAQLMNVFVDDGLIEQSLVMTNCNELVETFDAEFDVYLEDCIASPSNDDFDINYYIDDEFDISEFYDEIDEDDEDDEDDEQ